MKIERRQVGDAWVVRTTHVATGWVLSIATLGAPGSGALSLGGFRIAPRDRASAPGYDNDAEALGLAHGMEDKIRWSRLIRCGGPRVQPMMDRLVGGKCVLLPTEGARIGEPHDAALLDFAGDALNAFVREFGVVPVTGQDLGHGVMTDGVSSSLGYLHARYEGSVTADTSKPTGEGNVRLLLGALDALGRPAATATVGLIGLGNIGEHVLRRLRALGAQVIAIEPDPARRAAAEALGATAWTLDRKHDLLNAPLDALVVNARGGTLDAATVATLIAAGHCQLVCGCENLAMPDPASADALRAAGVAWFPTEFGGMMGYLTAAEEYLCRRAGDAFDVAPLFKAAERLEGAGGAITERWRRESFESPFEAVARAVYGSAR